MLQVYVLGLKCRIYKLRRALSAGADGQRVELPLSASEKCFSAAKIRRKSKFQAPKRENIQSEEIQVHTLR